MKQINHLYPAFHIRKWKEQGGKVYDKRMKGDIKIRPIDSKRDFSAKRYYSLGEKDDELEQRISFFECVIAPLIERIDSETEGVELTQQELELIKLYCLLCANRHSNTCEVIKSDESGVYKSNYYFIGTHRIETQEDVVSVTAHIIDEFERVQRIPNTENREEELPQTIKCEYSSAITKGLHLVIFRSESPIVLLSDRFCILENTMDSDHLYSYIPVSPQTVLLLVKTKYYNNLERFDATRIGFGFEYGSGTPDEYLSDLLGAEVGFYEDRLFPAIYTDSSMTELASDGCFSLYVKIQRLPKKVFQLYNSIFCEDGEKILFCDKKELDFALSHRLRCRDIEVVAFPF